MGFRPSPVTLLTEEEEMMKETGEISVEKRCLTYLLVYVLSVISHIPQQKQKLYDKQHTCFTLTFQTEKFMRLSYWACHDFYNELLGIGKNWIVTCDIQTHLPLTLIFIHHYFLEDSSSSNSLFLSTNSLKSSFHQAVPSLSAGHSYSAAQGP